MPVVGLSPAMSSAIPLTITTLHRANQHPSSTPAAPQQRLSSASAAPSCPALTAPHWDNTSTPGSTSAAPALPPTCSRKCRLRLMYLASFSCVCAASPVLPARSLPARSTKCSLERRTTASPPRRASMCSVKTQWEREEAWLRGVSATTRLVSPRKSCRSRPCGEGWGRAGRCGAGLGECAGEHGAEASQEADCQSRCQDAAAEAGDAGRVLPPSQHPDVALPPLSAALPTRPPTHHVERLLLRVAAVQGQPPEVHAAVLILHDVHLGQGRGGGGL